MEELEKEIAINDFIQLYRQSITQRAGMEMQRREIEKLAQENYLLKNGTAKPTEK